MNERERLLRNIEIAFYMAILGLTGWALASHGAEPASQCYWISCVVSDGKMSICGLVGSGESLKMEVAERRSRETGNLFIRECVRPGEQPEIKWNKKNGAVFFKDGSDAFRRGGAESP